MIATSRLRGTLWVALAILCAASSAYGVTKPHVNKFEPRTLEPGEKYKVYRLELREAIMSEAVPFFIHRALVAAKAAGAEAIVLDMDTPGGSVELMVEIRNELIELDVPTYTFVNNQAVSAGSLLAISTDQIVMSPYSYIGGAQVISGMGQEMSESVERKFTSVLLAQVRSTAIYKGHPVRICEAFVDKNIVIDGLTSGGMVLTMDQNQATTFPGLVDPSDPTSTRTLASFIAEDVEDLLKHEGIWPAEIMEYKLTWSEVLAKWILAVRGLLLLIGLGALFIEIKTPGIGVPGAIGVVALALFFWGSYLADLSGFLEVALLIVGVVLLLVEVFVIPGFGLAGVSGIILIFASLIMAMIKLPPPDLTGVGRMNWTMLGKALWTVIWVFALFIPLAWLLSKILPSTGLYRTLVLSPDQAARAGRAAAGRTRGATLDQLAEAEDLIGKTGEAITDLRPAGTAVVAGKRLDVVTEGEYVVRGARIRVIAIHGNVFTVAAAETK